VHRDRFTYFVCRDELDSFAISLGVVGVPFLR
jgi:hypothetical protein